MASCQGSGCIFVKRKCPQSGRRSTTALASPESSFGRDTTKGEGRIAMTHCDPSVVSSRDERWGNQCGRLLGLKAEGFLQCHGTEKATYPVKEGRRRGRLGSLTLDITR